MNHEQAQANLQLLLDWIDAMRRSSIDSIAYRFHADVVWVDVAGAVACEGREQVLAWLRAAPAQPPQVDALELLANDDHAVLGVRNHARQESSFAASAGRRAAALAPRRATRWSSKASTGSH